LLFERFQSRSRPRDFSIRRRKKRRIGVIPRRNILDVVAADDHGPRHHRVQAGFETIPLGLNLGSRMIERRRNLLHERLNMRVVSRGGASSK
jgi:hypothetical protein